MTKTCKWRESRRIWRRQSFACRIWNILKHHSICANLYSLGHQPWGSRAWWTRWTLPITWGSRSGLITVRAALSTDPPRTRGAPGWTLGSWLRRVRSTSNFMKTRASLSRWTKMAPILKQNTTPERSSHRTSLSGKRAGTGAIRSAWPTLWKKYSRMVLGSTTSRSVIRKKVIAKLWTTWIGRNMATSNTL